jgi:hypothetical protein
MRFTDVTITYPKISSVRHFFFWARNFAKTRQIIFLKEYFVTIFSNLVEKIPKKSIKTLNFLGHKLESDFSLVTFFKLGFKILFRKVLKTSDPFNNGQFE